MSRRQSSALSIFLFATVLGSFGAVSASLQSVDRDSLRIRQAIFEAEDSRAPDEGSLKILVDALKHSEAGIRRTAVRALGRLVRPALIGSLAPMLSDSDAAVRAEAANALAQSVADVKSGGSEIEDVRAALEIRLNSEQDRAVRGVIVQTAGRLLCPDEAVFRRMEKLLLAAAAEPGTERNPVMRPEVAGAVKGMEALLRRKAKTIQAGENLVARLRSLAAGGESREAGGSAKIEEKARIRRLAVMALTSAGGFDESTVEAASKDPDEQVRRLATAGAGRMKPESLSGGAAERLMRRSLADPSGPVRYEAVRWYGRTKLALDPAPVLESINDASSHVSLLAVDLLGQLKNASDPAVAGLGELVKAGSGQRAAHALVSLAKIAPERAREFLPAFMIDPEWVVRTYAATAAAVLKDIPALERLLADSHDNIRNEALSGLIALRGSAADEACLAALERNDHQLILTAAGGLKESPSAARAVPALLSCLARLTAQKRETSRDPRMAIIQRIGELGSKSQAEALSAYAGDFDPLVAGAAADIVAKWTGRRPDVHSRRLPVAYPRIADIEKLRSATVRVTMAGGGTFEMRLFVEEAPATIARFAANVRSGYYDGLTFHRIVPNFLIQGGSPGANEFAGDAMFMRDEPGLESNLRGTVGISTRGRDTGDAQIYINTIDNDRLDHDYAVFARITAGMDVVDRIREGGKIERMELISR